MALSKLELLVTAVMGRVAPLYPLSGVGSLTWSIGRKSLKGQGAPPRVVWVPTTEGFEGPTKTSLGQMTQRALRTRIAGVDAHCWGSDLGAAEALFEQVVGAMHAEAVGSYDITGASWPTEDEAQWLTQGELYLASFTVKIPVPDGLAATVVVTGVGFNTTGATTGDGVLQVGETP